ncbi:MAG TPA: hypothetical protein VGL21_18380 [Jatrophihabitantaceae bacterium]|jgi:hypothetical protein
MNDYFTAAIATERQHQFIAEAAQSRRSRSARKAKAADRGRARSLRVPAFRRHLAAA